MTAVWLRPVAPAGEGDVSALSVVGHVLHYGLLVGGLLGLLALVVLSRPGRSTTPPDRRAHRGVSARPTRARDDVLRERLALLREAGRTTAVAARPATRAHAGVLPRTRAAVERLEQLAQRTSGRPAPGPREQTLLTVAWVSSAGAAGVHAAMSPSHLQEGPLAGAFFLVAALAQLLWSMALVVLGPRRWLLVGALVGNLSVLATWLVSRTVGLPVAWTGAEEAGPEAVAAWDLAAGAWEVSVVVGVSLVLGSGRFGANAGFLLDIVRWSAAARWWAIGSVSLMVGLLVGSTL